VRQTFPSAADSYHLAADFAPPVHYRLNHRIQ
jgi:hypothetical protein